MAFGKWLKKAGIDSPLPKSKTVSKVVKAAKPAKGPKQVLTEVNDVTCQECDFFDEVDFDETNAVQKAKSHAKVKGHEVIVELSFSGE